MGRLIVPNCELQLSHIVRANRSARGIPNLCDSWEKQTCQEKKQQDAKKEIAR